MTLADAARFRTGHLAARFRLHHCRVCRACFETDAAAGAVGEYPETRLQQFLSPPVAAGASSAVAEPRRRPVCAYLARSMAKHLFALTDKAVDALPALTLTGQPAAALLMFGAGENARITLVTARDALAAAVQRWGSEAALASEAANRRAAAKAAHDKKVAAAKAAGKKSKPKAPPALRESMLNIPHIYQARVAQACVCAVCAATTLFVRCLNEASLHGAGAQGRLHLRRRHGPALRGAKRSRTRAVHTLQHRIRS
jgi:hypothetical protein